MNTCPHCKFLVTDDATTCSVCHKDITTPPAPVSEAAFAAPGALLAPGMQAQGTFAHAGMVPGSMPPPPGWVGPANGVGMPAAPTSKSSTGKVLLILGAVVVGLVGLAGLGIGALAFLADTPEIASGDITWSDYADAGGKFQIEMPGEAQVSTVEMPNGIGGKIDTEVVNVFGADFQASLTSGLGSVADGMTLADLPFSPDGAVRGAEANGFLDAKMVSHNIVDGSGDNQMDIEMNGMVDGEAAVMISRLVVVGSDIYEISIAGQLDQRAELLKVHGRMADSFTSPSDP
ncbi:MAG TPA: hypothetical protein VL068_01705 [Microthrixaceae bacterium]|nr:hypothetical protein [Microthrixaceae bacterium]